MSYSTVAIAVVSAAAAGIGVLFGVARKRLRGVNGALVLSQFNMPQNTQVTGLLILQKLLPIVGSPDVVSLAGDRLLDRPSQLVGATLSLPSTCGSSSCRECISLSKGTIAEAEGDEGLSLPTEKAGCLSNNESCILSAAVTSPAASPDSAAAAATSTHPTGAPLSAPATPSIMPAASSLARRGSWTSDGVLGDALQSIGGLETDVPGTPNGHLSGGCSGGNCSAAVEEQPAAIGLVRQEQEEEGSKEAGGSGLLGEERPVDTATGKATITITVSNPLYIREQDAGALSAAEGGTPALLRRRLSSSTAIDNPCYASDNDASSRVLNRSRGCSSNPNTLHRGAGGCSGSGSGCSNISRGATRAPQQQQQQQRHQGPAAAALQSGGSGGSSSACTSAAARPSWRLASGRACSTSSCCSSAAAGSTVSGSPAATTSSSSTSSRAAVSSAPTPRPSVLAHSSRGPRLSTPRQHAAPAATSLRSSGRSAQPPVAARADWRLAPASTAAAGPPASQPPCSGACSARDALPCWPPTLPGSQPQGPCSARGGRTSPAAAAAAAAAAGSAAGTSGTCSTPRAAAVRVGSSGSGSRSHRGNYRSGAVEAGEGAAADVSALQQSRPRWR
ncbi:hypothetical protein Agub_g15414 [Astrephomene gubernaculifera]|uniref:Uncharacterized protein n=1 Tax=Astrephomene gubernaculifera TaxID=47775 RepID=A0AAD3E5G6_9CHLO|nr:hypothetical protein Agub_g15414 [Astrephomene gubernaculifera]